MINDSLQKLANHTATVIVALMLTSGLPIVTQAADDPPLNLARDGFFYAGGKPVKINGKTYIAGQMYVEFRIPAKQTHPYPLVMVHGGTRSGANWTGTPDGREGWAQYFARRGYAVYVVDQPGRGRSAYVKEVYGEPRFADAESAQRRYMQQEKFKPWPQAAVPNQALPLCRTYARLLLFGRPDVPEGTEQGEVVHNLQHPTGNQRQVLVPCCKERPGQRRARRSGQAARDGREARCRCPLCRRHNSHDVGGAGRHVHLRERGAQQQQPERYLCRRGKRGGNQAKARWNVREHHGVHQADAAGQPSGDREGEGRQRA